MCILLLKASVVARESTFVTIKSRPPSAGVYAIVLMIVDIGSIAILTGAIA